MIYTLVYYVEYLGRDKNTREMTVLYPPVEARLIAASIWNVSPSHLCLCTIYPSERVDGLTLEELYS